MLRSPHFRDVVVAVPNLESDKIQMRKAHIMNFDRRSCKNVALLRLNATPLSPLLSVSVPFNVWDSSISFEPLANVLNATSLSP